VTPGRWTVQDDVDGYRHIHKGHCEKPASRCSNYALDSGINHNDAPLIAALHNAAPKLLDVVRAGSHWVENQELCITNQDWCRHCLLIKALAAVEEVEL